MTSRIIWQSVFACCFVVVSYVGYSQNKSSNNSSSTANYKLSSQRIKLIENCISKYTIDELSEEETIQKIRDEIGEKMPLIPTETLLKEDSASLKKQVQKMLEKEYGSSGTIASRIDAEAKKKYPLYRVGDRITLDYFTNSRYYSVTGRLIRIAAKTVTVDDKKINLIDLSEDERAKFDSNTNQILRERYARTQMVIENQKKTKREQELIQKLKKDIPQRNEKAGYIYDSTREKWVTAQEYTESLVKVHKKGQGNKEELFDKKDDESNVIGRTETRIDKVGEFSFGQKYVGTTPSFLGVPGGDYYDREMFFSVGLYDAAHYAIFSEKKYGKRSSIGTINTAYLLYTPISKQLFCIVMHSDNYSERNEYADSMMKKYGVTFNYKEKQYGPFNETYRREASFDVQDTSVFFVTEYTSVKGLGSAGDVNIFYINRTLEKVFKSEFKSTKQYKDDQKRLAEQEAKKEKEREQARKAEEERHQQKKDLIDSL